MLLVLAALNKLRFVPQLSKGNVLAVRDLAKTIKAEWALVALILMATAVLTTISKLP
jgi:putative copper resistance protein D